MLQKVLDTLIKHLDEGTVLDVFRKNSYVGMWKENSQVIALNSVQRKLAEKIGCEGVLIKLNDTELYIVQKHLPFNSKQELYSFLKEISSDVFYLSTHGKSYPAPDNLYVKVEYAWLKIRADYSMIDTPSSTILGTFSITPSKNKGMVLVDWRDDNNSFPQYHYNLKISDIEVLDEYEITAELL